MARGYRFSMCRAVEKSTRNISFTHWKGGSDGIFVIACSRGECRLGQGNYRAEIRIKTVQRLLSEIGLESKRIELMHSSPDVTADELMQAIQEAAGRFSALGANPIRSAI